MARVLLAWGFGAGLGHLNRLLAVGRELRRAGHAVAVAVPRPALHRPVIDRAFPDGVPVHEGWFWRVGGDVARARQVTTDSFADVLRIFGFHDPDTLTAAARQWSAVLEAAKPDLVVSDFAPTLALVADPGLPRVALGNGYTVPPAGRPLPPMRPWRTDLAPASVAHEAEVLDTVNRVRGQHGLPPVAFLADLFSAPRTYVCTIPEFDPYNAYRLEPTLTPFNVPRIAAGPPVARRGKGPVAVYLPGNHPNLGEVMAVLRDSGVPALAHVSAPVPDGLAALVPPNVTLSTAPLALETVLPTARLLIHHTGLATAYAGLQAGVPQLVLPINLEHAITARGLERFGGTLARSAIPGSAREIGVMLKRLLIERALGVAADRAARTVGARPAEDSLGIVVAGCRDLLGG